MQPQLRRPFKCPPPAGSKPLPPSCLPLATRWNPVRRHWSATWLGHYTHSRTASQQSTPPAVAPFTTRRSFRSRQTKITRCHPPHPTPPDPRPPPVPHAHGSFSPFDCVQHAILFFSNCSPPQWNRWRRSTCTSPHTSHTSYTSYTDLQNNCTTACKTLKSQI